MGISVQLCAASILILLFLLLINKRKIVLRSQQLFQFMLATNFFSICLNGAFVLTIDTVKKDYGLFEIVFSRLYIISLIFLCGFAFIYFTMEISRTIAIVQKINWYAMIVTTMWAVAAFFMPVKFDIKKNNIYIHGALITFCAVFIVITIVIDAFIMLRYRRYIDRRRWEAGFFWVILWCASAVFQYGFHIQICEYICSLAMCVLFIKLENPEGFFDRETGLFNEQSLSSYISHFYDTYENFSMLVIFTNQMSINEAHNANTSSSSKSFFITKVIANYLNTITDSIAFHNSNTNMTMLFESKEKMYAASKIIQKRFSEEWFFETFSVIMNSTFFEIPDCSVADDEASLMELVGSFTRESMSNSSAKCFTLDSEWIEKNQKEKEMAAIVSDAIEQDRVEVFYQPIYSTALKRFVSAEALVRIRKSDGNLIMPGAFINVAEKNGLIVELGKMVFRKACLYIKENHLEEKGIKYLEINLSAVQCVKKELADQYIEIMEDLEIDPKMINLEITESAALSSKENLIANMEKLINYGVEFSLDDFGTGYSNLNYITELPVSIVKFDRQMTNSYFESRKGKLVMEAAIGMIKAVGTKIVSEGVETKNQLEELEKICIDYIQGYYFSKPICGDDFLKLLEHNLDNDK